MGQSTVLIVDDTPVNIRFLAGILRDEYRILVATGGEEAIRIAQRENPDLLLLDITMPQMDGYQTLERLKGDIRTQKIPVIFVTARDSLEDEARGLDLGAIDYITKPGSPAIIRARVRNHLELKHYRDTLERLSTQDGLTEIANRRYFDAMLDQEWRRGTRSGTPLTLMLMDVDFFKRFNDHYGHQAGDDCLRAVAATLRGALHRVTDCVARYGGEEFAAIFPGLDASKVTNTAERLLTQVRSLAIPHAQSTVADHVTLSIGAATTQPHRNAAVQDLLKAADEQLYAAKKGGRNSFRQVTLPT
ncbi:MAG: diguanylate cyclase [Magnetococcales bacterium]|nr:diguanylate cyclase [Magnetococcales bacterium]MBF0150854.1 diguanylate cyclase [Magnetococcales bacterium]MBF0173849.1 diguanylate cyclase [Magnetococcales bacterium]MBF0347013.1 diguanylate cyclase [Magnetococcales bacterium]MBF0631333.1 diguanylate cyclase [Magnetococcales bacterium]